MEFKTPTEDLKSFVERAQEFWKYIDVDSMQPIIHSSEEISEEVMNRRKEAFEASQKNMELFEKQKNSINKDAEVSINRSLYSISE